MDFLCSNFYCALAALQVGPYKMGRLCCFVVSATFRYYIMEDSFQPSCCLTPETVH